MQFLSKINYGGNFPINCNARNGEPAAYGDQIAFISFITTVSNISDFFDHDIGMKNFR